METVIDEITSAAKALGLGPNEFRQLPPSDSAKVYFNALQHFVSSGDRRWWWEDFRVPSTSVRFPAGNGWRLMPKVAPNPDALVWLIAEEDQLPHYPVFETTPRIATKIIGECYGFEFYLIAKNFEWLLCETHHNNVFAIGSLVEERLRRYA
jgi:hypothetical protein